MYNWQQTFNFVFPTKIIFGPGSIAQCADELRALNACRPLIVTDQGVIATGIVDRLTRGLFAVGIEFSIFDDVQPNPKDINVEAGAMAARAFGADSLIAIGGGSPIDCAKSIGVLLAHEADKIKAFEGKNAATKPQPAFITIPTTSGTGSEITFSSVITDTKNNYKMTIKSPFTAAKTAICDPSLTLSMPRSLTAATGMDALTHAIEGFTANCTNPLADTAALYSIELIYQSLLQAYTNPEDVNARSAMLMGSLLGAISFSHSDVAAVHCIAEALGGLYDLPHGVCNAVFLPFVMRYNMKYSKERYARIARAMGHNFQSIDEGAQLAVESVEALAHSVQLPAFSSLGVDETHFAQIARLSYQNGSNLSNPRPMAEDDYMAILKIAHAAK